MVPQGELHQRAIHVEALREQWIDSSAKRVERLGEQLRQISAITGPMQFRSPLREIPADEYHEQVQDWLA